ncbi:WD40-repeat-containing domain protein, partial [Fusarium solani]
DWDACLLVLEGHSDLVYSVVFLLDSNIVASASGDKTVRIWNAKTGKCEQVLKGHSNSANSVVFSHDSKMATSASDDGTARIWSMETGARVRIVPLGFSTRRLYFTGDDVSGLVTGVGVFSVKNKSNFAPSPIYVGSASSSIHEFSVDGITSWISYGERQLIWLPSWCRYGETAISGNRVVIGCRSGTLVFFSFSLSELRSLA